MNTQNRDDFRYRIEPVGSYRRNSTEEASASVKTLSSVDLFQGTREIGIEHSGALYRLRITRQGKLILNK